MKTFVFIVLVNIALSGTARAAGSPENGRKLFEKYGCYQCHGYAGQGSAAGARIASTSLSLQGFTRYVRRPGGEMPAYTGKVVLDEELADIYAYLKSLPTAKPSKDIPLLNEMRTK